MVRGLWRYDNLEGLLEILGEAVNAYVAVYDRPSQKLCIHADHCPRAVGVQLGKGSSVACLEADVHDYAARFGGPNIARSCGCLKA